MNREPIHVIAHLSVQAEHAGRAAAILKTLAQKARQAEGNVRFETFTHAGDPSKVATVETWSDAAAADAHMASGYVAAALGELGPLLAGPPAIERFV